MSEQRRATALHYSGSAAPKVVATGHGLIAERILDIARESGVPIKEDPALADLLASLDLGAEVPEDLYIAVAEAIAWAYRLDARTSRDRG
jgi:flagellar biosynthesis protein